MNTLHGQNLNGNAKPADNAHPPFLKHSLENGAVWLVPKIYSTQNTAVMFVQYISPFTLDILELVWYYGYSGNRFSITKCPTGVKKSDLALVRSFLLHGR